MIVIETRLETSGYNVSFGGGDSLGRPADMVVGLH